MEDPNNILESITLQEDDCVVIIRNEGQIEVITAAREDVALEEQPLTWAESTAMEMVSEYLEKHEKEMTKLPDGVLN